VVQEAQTELGEQLVLELALQNIVAAMELLVTKVVVEGRLAP
jgi:hypothetical protein